MKNHKSKILKFLFYCIILSVVFVGFVRSEINGLARKRNGKEYKALQAISSSRENAQFASLDSTPHLNILDPNNALYIGNSFSPYYKARLPNRPNHSYENDEGADLEVSFPLSNRTGLFKAWGGPDKFWWGTRIFDQPSQPHVHTVHAHLGVLPPSLENFLADATANTVIYVNLMPPNDARYESVVFYSNYAFDENVNCLNGWGIYQHVNRDTRWVVAKPFNGEFRAKYVRNNYLWTLLQGKWPHGRLAVYLFNYQISRWEEQIVAPDDGAINHDHLGGWCLTEAVILDVGSGWCSSIPDPAIFSAKDINIFISGVGYKRITSPDYGEIFIMGGVPDCLYRVFLDEYYTWVSLFWPT